jgi:hypothetical protein
VSVLHTFTVNYRSLSMRKFALVITILLAACGGTKPNPARAGGKQDLNNGGSNPPDPGRLILDTSYNIDTGLITDTTYTPVLPSRTDDVRIYASGANCRASVTAVWVVSDKNGQQYPLEYNGQDWVASDLITFSQMGFNFYQQSGTGFIEVAGARHRPR